VHVCPCCVGNLARTLLMIPTGTYVKSNDGLYVNMFVGSRIHVGQVRGTNVEVGPEDGLSLGWIDFNHRES